MQLRHFSFIDRALIEVNRALSTTCGGQQMASRPSPSATTIEHNELTESERQHAAGLMRVNHTGEVCAQALYSGQAAVSHNEAIREHLFNAATEETDHLVWCAERLKELRSRPSLLNPLWYLGSFTIGALAGVVNDRVSLGFVVETERQVEAHLGEHMTSLPQADERSRAIVGQMKEEEARHGQTAQQAGAIALPTPLPLMMHLAASIMKAVAYRL